MPVSYENGNVGGFSNMAFPCSSLATFFILSLLHAHLFPSVSEVGWARASHRRPRVVDANEFELLGPGKAKPLRRLRRYVLTAAYHTPMKRAALGSLIYPRTLSSTRNGPGGLGQHQRSVFFHSTLKHLLSTAIGLGLHFPERQGSGSLFARPSAFRNLLADRHLSLNFCSFHCLRASPSGQALLLLLTTLA